MYIDSLTLGSMARFLYVMIPVSVRTSFRNVFEEGAKYFGGDLKCWCAIPLEDEIWQEGISGLIIDRVICLYSLYMIMYWYNYTIV